MSQQWGINYRCCCHLLGICAWRLCLCHWHVVFLCCCSHCNCDLLVFWPWLQDRGWYWSWGSRDRDQGDHRNFRRERGQDWRTLSVFCCIWSCWHGLEKEEDFCTFYHSHRRLPLRCSVWPFCCFSFCCGYHYCWCWFNQNLLLLLSSVPLPRSNLKVQILAAAAQPAHLTACTVCPRCYDWWAIYGKAPPLPQWGHKIIVVTDVCCPPPSCQRDEVGFVASSVLSSCSTQPAHLPPRKIIHLVSLRHGCPDGQLPVRPTEGTTSASALDATGIHTEWTSPSCVRRVGIRL